MIIYIALFIAVSKEVYRIWYPQEYQVLVTNVRNKITDINIKAQPILINAGYNIIYIYSLHQIYVNKIISIVNLIYRSLMTILKKQNLVSNDETKCMQILSFYKNGKEFDQIIYENNKQKNFKCFIEELTPEIDYDLLILSDKVETPNIINKVHYSECPDTTDYTTSNIKFISMELTYNDTPYPVELKNDIYNHYIVNNVLNDEFFKYYLLNVLKVEINNDNFDYKVFVIDHNVNMFELSPTSHIIIKENDYEFIVNTVNNLVSNKQINVNNMIVDETVINNIEDDKSEDDKSENRPSGSDDYVKLEHQN